MPIVRGGPGDLETALAFTTGATVTSSQFYPAPGNSVATFSIKPTRAGTWRVYGYALNLSDRVDLTSARAVAADTYDAATVEGCYAAFAVDFTEGGANSGTAAVRVEGCDRPQPWGV